MQKMSTDSQSAPSNLIAMALAEDIGSGDITTELLIDQKQPGRAVIIARQDLVCCGLNVVKDVYARINADVRVRRLVDEGERVPTDVTLAEIQGPFHALLTGERVALNFLQRLSGIASLTRTFSDAIAHTRTTLLDTRKTTPGWRILEKTAVRCGGGANHRMGLFDAILIKENHIAASGGIKPALEKTRAERHPDLKIEIEVRSLEEFQQAIDCGPDMILLDNMSCKDMRQAVELNTSPILLEASGNVNLKTIAEIAATGVDYISVGALTHSAPAADVSMLIEPA
jgi:nicotinate-nucleotide pyrophosphorylase (carboxylating)